MKSLNWVNYKNLYFKIVLLLVILINLLKITTATVELRNKSKPRFRRQVFREEFSPLIGGRVPSGALNWFRLMFNNLDSRGISIPDGFILSNDRTPPEGVRSDERRIKLYSDVKDKYIDSTYTVRNPVPTRHIVPRTKTKGLPQLTKTLSSPSNGTDQEKEDEPKASGSTSHNHRHSNSNQRKHPSFIHDIKTIEAYLENPNDERYSNLPGFIKDYDHHYQIPEKPTVPATAENSNIIINSSSTSSIFPFHHSAPGHIRHNTLKPQGPEIDNTGNGAFVQYSPALGTQQPSSSPPNIPYNFHHQPPQIPLNQIHHNKPNYNPMKWYAKYQNHSPSPNYNNHYYSPSQSTGTDDYHHVHDDYYRQPDCQAKKLYPTTPIFPVVKNEYNLTDEKFISKDETKEGDKPEAISPHVTFSSELSYYENPFPDLLQNEKGNEEKQTTTNENNNKYHAQIQQRNNFTNVPIPPIPKYSTSARKNNNIFESDFNDDHSVDLVDSKKENDVQKTSPSLELPSSSFPLLLDDKIESGKKDFYFSTPILSRFPSNVGPTEMDSYDKFKSALIDEIIARLKASAYDSTTHHIVTILPPMKLLGKNSKDKGVVSGRSRNPNTSSSSSGRSSRNNVDDITKLQLIVKKLINFL